MLLTQQARWKSWADCVLLLFYRLFIDSYLIIINFYLAMFVYLCLFNYDYVCMCLQGALVHEMRYLASVVTTCFSSFGELLALNKRFAELSGGIVRYRAPLPEPSTSSHTARAPAPLAAAYHCIEGHPRKGWLHTDLLPASHCTLCLHSNRAKLGMSILCSRHSCSSAHESCLQAVSDSYDVHTSYSKRASPIRGYTADAQARS